MVGVVGSSPIAPTSRSSLCRNDRSTERHGYDTANAQGIRLENARSHVVVSEKVRLARTFCFWSPPCPRSHCPTAASRSSPRRFRSPRSPPRSAPASPRPRWPGRVDGKVVDTSHRIDRDASLAIVTAKDAAGLDVLRHSTAHLLAYAVKELFPDAQVTIGPVIEDGFYYDFAFKRPFTPEDLAAIEKKMAELAKKDEPVTRKVMSRDDAVAYFKALGEHYKAEIIASIPAEQDISLYSEGQVHRPLPRAARAVDRQAQGLQADEGRRRVLARRFEERDAPAHLRHRVGEQGRPRRLPHRASRKRRSATTGGSAGSSTSSTCRTKRREWCSGIRRAGPCGSRSSSTCAACTRTTAISR